MRYIPAEGSKKNRGNRAFSPVSYSSGLCPRDLHTNPIVAVRPGTLVPQIDNWRWCFCLSYWLQARDGIQKKLPWPVSWSD